MKPGETVQEYGARIRNTEINKLDKAIVLANQDDLKLKSWKRVHMGASAPEAASTSNVGQNLIPLFKSNKRIAYLRTENKFKGSRDTDSEADRRRHQRRSSSIQSGRRLLLDSPSYTSPGSPLSNKDSNSHHFEDPHSSIAFTQKNSSSVDPAILKVNEDTTQDTSKIDQLSQVFRFVKIIYDEKGQPIDLHIAEVFTSFTPVNDQSSLGLEKLLTDCLEKMSLDLRKCRGQEYDDGATVLSGSYSGLQKRIKDLAPHAHLVHCAVHNLNLVLQDAVSCSREIEGFLKQCNLYMSFSVTA
ncbi:uncharacterized protein LOC117177677 [Belonocnema kinseyi]|uniref:uncharacterized protein LOC117177677 n=1 Tax=Belonocnema kinseyi TaxID=2817044 RepID=UPI00143D514B|nr:uncharacterized protein LOC117177677 [Belonocnema kinseyi]